MGENILLKRIQTYLRVHYFPNAHDKVVKQWEEAAGETRLRYEFDLTRDSVVLDLGGYQGQWASDVFGRYVCNIHVFEPVKSFAEQLGERFHQNPQIVVHPFGLGGSTRQETIHIGKDGSSVFRSFSRRETIDIVDVVEWFKRERIASVDLLKVNIEGGEYELFDRLFDGGLIDKIGRILVQFHDLDSTSTAKMMAIQQRLRETHVPEFQYEFVWEKWRRKGS